MYVSHYFINPFSWRDFRWIEGGERIIFFGVWFEWFEEGKLMGYECFSFWAHQKMLRKKKRTILAPWWSIVLPFFFFGLVVSLFFSFSQSGRMPQMHCVYFFWFFKKLGTIVFYFLFVNLPFLFLTVQDWFFFFFLLTGHDFCFNKLGVIAFFFWLLLLLIVCFFFIGCTFFLIKAYESIYINYIFHSSIFLFN